MKLSKNFLIIDTVVNNVTWVAQQKRFQQIIIYRYITNNLKFVTFSETKLELSAPNLMVFSNKNSLSNRNFRKSVHLFRFSFRKVINFSKRDKL